MVKKNKIPIKDRSSAQEFHDSVKQYTHEDFKRANNPPVGLVTAETDKLDGQKRYHFDPHIDPQLQWAGKKEGISFEVDTVSLHVHERIDPLTIIENVKKKEEAAQLQLFHYFESAENNPPIREAIEFYKHSQNWSNRLVAGDSLIIMNSLLEKEGMAGKVQMVYIDPPYGIKYGSNFQPFVNKREVKDGKDEDLTQEPEMIKAFRDTWELGIHSYLTYLRDRLKLTKELLKESGSCFVQISEENVHHVKELMDEVFGIGNFVSLISFSTTSAFTSTFLSRDCDYIVWYAKNKKELKYNSLFFEQEFPINDPNYRFIELPTGVKREMTDEEKNNPLLIQKGARIYRLGDATSQGHSHDDEPIIIGKKKFEPPSNRHWTYTTKGTEKLMKLNRAIPAGNNIALIRYFDDYKLKRLTNTWTDTSTGGFNINKIYVVQTNTKVIERCLLMVTEPGDLALDPTCGSGTTAYVAEKWGRRWITCDTSRVAITLAKQRVMTAVFDYYNLAHPSEGVSSGFIYETVPHVTLKSIANNEPASQEALYDKPTIDKKRKRVSGPFTMEAVPSQTVMSLDKINSSQPADVSISRERDNLRPYEWIEELTSAGIRGKNNQKIEFARMELLPATRWLEAEGETRTGEKVVVSFGPEYAPLEQRQVELAIEEAQKLVPKPKLIIFASFQFDPEAAKDIDELNWPGVAVLKVQMNTDLLTDDLKKKRSSNESFWLIGQPDIELKKEGKKYVVKVNGFDYYNTKTGTLESGDSSKIAMWELDTDYDGRSLYPKQVFFPLAGSGEGWDKLAKTVKGVIDEELIEKYKGNVSIPFVPGDNKRIAVKIIDDRGIESLKVIEVQE